MNSLFAMFYLYLNSYISIQAVGGSLLYIIAVVKPRNVKKRNIQKKKKKEKKKTQKHIAEHQSCTRALFHIPYCSRKIKPEISPGIFPTSPSSK